ncbi:MAG: M23 family metallopeptidase [Acidimicrobiales bacterium]|nr:M23 family metallopeptidase [Acidimicrobiales bacterium]
MTSERRRAVAALAVAASLVAALLAAPGTHAQTNPIGDLFTTTTTATPTTTPPTAAPDAATAAEGGAGGEEPAEAPAGAEDAKGDGAPAPSSGIVVPPEAQRIIDAVKRTGSNSNARLLTAISELVALGMTEAEAHRAGLGRFPIAGPARYSHDWLFPRYGPGFRFHLGTDVFAAHGTPVRAPVDGVAQSHNDSLGGLSVRVIMPDKTYFYLAHLSGLVEGFRENMPVTTGDVLGYVGDSGNAKGGAPHVHLGLYPKGGPPVDPKPVLDGFLAEAEALLPQVVAAYKASRPVVAAPAVPVLPVVPDQRLLRPTLATRAVHPFASGGDGWSPAALYLLATDPAAGAGYLLQSALDDLAADIDWSTR